MLILMLYSQRWKDPVQDEVQLKQSTRFGLSRVVVYNYLRCKSVQMKSGHICLIVVTTINEHICKQLSTHEEECRYV
jgi:hypothetical protein